MHFSKLGNFLDQLTSNARSLRLKALTETYIKKKENDELQKALNDKDKIIQSTEDMIQEQVSKRMKGMQSKVDRLTNELKKSKGAAATASSTKKKSGNAIRNNNTQRTVVKKKGTIQNRRVAGNGSTKTTPTTRSNNSVVKSKKNTRVLNNRNKQSQRK